jgi:predicted RND superfamily exporter protein
MIARNAVILIDQIETVRSQERDIWDAVVEATLSRFRPIILTAVSTVLGLIPIAPTVFWGPMAFAIMGGLFVATMLTLPVLPVFYITLYRAKQPRQQRQRRRAPHFLPQLGRGRWREAPDGACGDVARPPAAGHSQGEPAGELMELQLPSDRRGGTGAHGRRYV